MVRLNQPKEAFRFTPFLEANYRISKETRRSAKELIFCWGSQPTRAEGCYVSWHGTMLNCPGWDDGQAKVLGFTLAGFEDDPDIHVMMNMYWEPLDMAIPMIPGRQWTRAVDTSLPSPSDIADPGTEVTCSGPSYRVNGRSIVVLVNKCAFASDRRTL
jgi:pullulanase/glycogen debranching enzyme